MITALNQFIRNVIQFSEIYTRFLSNALEMFWIQTSQTNTLPNVKVVYNFYTARKHRDLNNSRNTLTIIKIQINYQVWQIRRTHRVRQRQEVWISIDSCWGFYHCNSTSWPGHRFFFRVWMLRRKISGTKWIICWFSNISCVNVLDRSQSLIFVGSVT